MKVEDKSRNGLNLLKEAITEYINLYPEGVSNGDIARALGLESDFGGNQKNYLSWSVIGLLVKEGKIVRFTKGRNVFYKKS